MKTRIMVAGFLLACFTANAVAGENFVQTFLNRYKPSPTAAARTAATPLTVDQAVEVLIRNGSLPLTIPDMIRLMLDSSLDVRVYRFSPLESQYLITSALRAFEPTLHVNFGVSRNTFPGSSQLDGATAPSQLSHNYGVGFTQVLKQGTLIDLEFGMNRSSSNSVFSTFNPSYSGNLSYRISQPLLRNYGRDITTRQILVAQNNKTVSELQFETELIDMVTQAQQLYWDLVMAREDIRVKQKSLELAQKTLHDNQRQVEIGTLAPIEVVQAEAEVASREEQLVTTTYTSDQAQDRAKRVITHLSDPALVLAKLSPVEAAHRPSSDDLMPVQDAIKYALENRPEIRQLEFELKNNDIDIKYSKNQLLPQFDVSASYTQRGIGGVQTIRSGLGGGTIVDVQHGGVWDAFDQIFSNNYRGYGIGVSISIPLSNKAAQADYDRALTGKQVSEARRSMLAQKIAVDVRNAHSRVEMNRARIEAAEKSLEFAQRRLSAEEKKNQLGVSSIRFLLDEQRNVTAAEETSLTALINYTKSLVDYDQAVGRTLRHHNVEIDKQIQIAGRPQQPAHTGN
jgi:outer membrane protein TolC